MRWSLRDWRKALPLIWVGFVTLVVAFEMVMIARTERPGDPVEFVFGAIFLLSPALLTSLATVIWRRQRGNRVAILLFIVGASILLQPILNIWSPADPPIQPTFWNYFASVASTLTVLPGMFFPLFLALFVFPTGQFLSKRWSWPVRVFVVIFPATAFAAIFTSEIEAPFVGWKISNPIGLLPNISLDVLMVLWIALLWATALGGIAAIVVRYRRSSSDVRAQIRWVAFASVIAAASFFLVNTGVVLPDNTALFALEQALGVSAVPIAITIAITRYRLYDIDRIISRTVGYGLLLALLGVVYVAGAVWLPTRLLGEQPPIFTAGSTLAVAALFTPLRHRVIRWVDRRFYRSRFDAETVIARFGDRLRDELDVDRLTEDSIAVISRTMQPSVVAIWVRE